MNTSFINWLKPAWHFYKKNRLAAKWAFGQKMAEASRTDYRKVVLISNYGRGFLCNAKYIAKALERLYPGEYDIVLLVNEVDSIIPSYVRQVKYDSRDAQRELASARFWIDNCRGPKFVPKRTDQLYIQTWHASLGPKRCERDVEEHLDASYVSDAKNDGSIIDLMLADNRLEAEKYQRAFWYNGPVLKTGIPRNAPLFGNNEALKKKVRNDLGIPNGAALCLYAPTFRADWAISQYEFDFQALIDALERRFGRSFVFAYRLHPNFSDLPRPAFFNGHIDATGYDDAQELLSAVDVLVSDYSSIMEDFMLTGRPGFQYVPDIEDYLDDRGLYYSLDSRPFPVASNQTELLDCVADFDVSRFESKRREFMKLAGFVDDGRGDERVASLIHKLSNPRVGIQDVLTDKDIWIRNGKEAK